MSTSTKKVYQDPAEAALSAIEEALSLDLNTDEEASTAPSDDDLPPAREPQAPRIEVRGNPEFEDDFASDANTPFLSESDLFGHVDEATAFSDDAFELTAADLDLSEPHPETEPEPAFAASPDQETFTFEALEAALAEEDAPAETAASAVSEPDLVAGLSAAGLAATAATAAALRAEAPVLPRIDDPSAPRIETTRTETRAPGPRAAKPARQAANDDRQSIGQLLGALQRRPSSAPYVIAGLASAAWVGAGAALTYSHLNLTQTSLGDLLGSP